MTLSTLIITVAAGIAGGALLGSTRSCHDGGCPLTATPWRGAIYGGVMGLAMGLLLSSPVAANPPAKEPPATAAVAEEDTPEKADEASMDESDGIVLAKAEIAPRARSANRPATAAKPKGTEAEETKVDPMAGKARPIASTADFEAAIASTEDVAIVVFGADWCPACRQYDPVVIQAARDLAGEAKTYTVDVDAARDVAIRSRVQYLPTTVIFEKGREKTRFAGAVDKARLLNIIRD